MKEKPKKRSVKGKAKHKKIEKKLITGHTDVLDFDFDDEILLREEADEVLAEAGAALAESVQEVCEEGPEMSDAAADEAAEAAETAEEPAEFEAAEGEPAEIDAAEGEPAEIETTEIAEAAAEVEKAEEQPESESSSWDTMPEKEVSIGDETMEMLGLENILLDEAEADSFEDESAEPADYINYVPKKSSRPAGVPARKKRRKKGFLANMDMMDRIIAATGVLVVLVAILTAGIFNLSQSSKKQVAAMAEIGAKMETIGVAGEGIFTAVADARIAAQEVAEYAEETYEEVEYEEKELTTEMNVGLKLTSVQKDLKIKFTNKSSGKLIGNQPFEVKIEGPENLTKTDDDEDGIIYISSIKAGEYTVTITAPEEIDGNKVKGVSSVVTVKDQIEYKKIDVADEVKTESEINAAKEDTAVAVEIESVSTDTVEWVESTKTAIGGSVSYVAVKKSDIPDPANSASAGFLKIAAMDAGDESESQIEMLTENESESETQTESEKESESETEKESESESEKETETQKPSETIKVTSVIIDYSDITMTVGNSKTLTASVEPSDAADQSVSWFSSDSSVATVDGSGKVTAVSAGTADVTAAANDGSGASDVCRVTVKAAEEEKTPVSVTLEAPGTMSVGEEKQLKWTAAGDVDASKTSFKSSDTKLATVDSSGKVKALAKGSVTVTVTVADKAGKTAEASGTLTISDSTSVTISLSPSSTSVKVGDKVTVKATVTSSGSKSLTWKSGDESLAKITSSSDTECVVEALKAGTVSITATSKEKTDVTASCSIKISANVDLTAKLKDSAGNQLYVKDGDNYREATVADYYNYDTFYKKQDNAQYTYTGWQNIDGKRYYFDKNGVPVTGDQIIQGMQYSFNSDGSLKVTGAFGIDVSKHNGSIDWTAVKNAGVDFVIIRCGYRGSATGVLVEDPKFKTNIQGAAAAGLKVGIYFFSQAVNEVEAVEEASMTISLINKYKITYPVYIDVEAANGRADGMDAATRTKVIKAYCQTIKNSGYTAGIYANKTWLNSKFNVGELGSYKIWLAQYATTPTYNGRYEMWQYSSTGRISGISGNVDLNTSYMTY